MAVAIGATAGTALSGASAGATGALLSNPLGWAALGAGLLMQMEAQDQANAQRKKAYEIQTSNLAMQRNQELQKLRTETLQAQDELVEQKLDNLISSMEQKAKVKAGAKGKMNTANAMRLIKSAELQGNTKINKAYTDMLNAYETNADNIFKRTDAKIRQLANEFAEQDNTGAILLNTFNQFYGMKKQGDIQSEMEKRQKRLLAQISRFENRRRYGDTIKTIGGDYMDYQNAPVGAN